MIKNTKIRRAFSLPGVYMIRNRETGKCYIGSASDVLDRLNNHRSNLYNHKHQSSELQSDYDRGHRFDFDVLYIEAAPRYGARIDREKLYRLEREYIEKYDSINSGYNTAPVSSAH